MTLNQLRGYGWPTVTINFNLRSLHNPRLGEVRPDQFVVEENGVAQKVTGVALGHDIGVPLSVVLALDTSGSMAGPKLIAAQAAAASFIGALGPQDEVALVPFGTTVVLSPTAFTTDCARITAALNAQQAKGNTALYDAVYEFARLVNTSTNRQPPRHRAAHRWPGYRQQEVPGAGDGGGATGREQYVLAGAATRT